VLRRSITDADIAEYPVLQTYSAASNLEVQVEPLLSWLQGVALGASVMANARPAYQEAQNYKGRTPGAHAIMECMTTRFAQNPAAPVVPRKRLLLRCGGGRLRGTTGAALCPVRAGGCFSPAHACPLSQTGELHGWTREV